MLEAALNVEGDLAAGFFAVAAGQGFVNGAVLKEGFFEEGAVVLEAIGGEDAGVGVTVGGELGQAVIPGGLDHRHVEGEIGGEEIAECRAIEKGPFLGEELGADGFHAFDETAELGETRAGDGGGGFEGGVAFHGFADAVELDGLLARKRRDDSAEAGDELEQSFAGELADGFAHRRGADAEVHSELLEIEAGARGVVAREEAAADFLVAGGGAGRRGHGGKAPNETGRRSMEYALASSNIFGYVRAAPQPHVHAPHACLHATSLDPFRDHPNRVHEMSRLALGLDFGTESVRALLVDLQGRERGVAVAKYRHGQILDRLPGNGAAIEPDCAFQHPGDWIEAMAKAVRTALRVAGAEAGSVVGMGVDFTSCTMLPALADGTPLCLTEKWRGNVWAWPKLWKHHGAQQQTDRLNAVARERREPWLARYGGIVGLEWFFPKMLETLERAPGVYAATEVWLEAGDWLVWQMVGGSAADLPRSTCQAGYKGLWNAEAGFPSEEFFAALHPKMERVVAEKMPGRFYAPGQMAGGLSAAMAAKLGLHEGTPVSAAIIDAHAGVPGAGAAEADTLVMVMGTSSCHMLNSEVERVVPGVAGVVRDGILPGYYGYETGQAAVGDAFEWARRLVGAKSFGALTEAAAELPIGSDGVRCMDWFNGCRTPLMNGALSGAFTGLTLRHGSAHLFRSVLEASACGLRWIVDTLREGGVPVRRFVATGGLPHHNPIFLQMCADVLGERIEVPSSKQGPALGAAILGAMAAGMFSNATQAIKAMTKQSKPTRVLPSRAATRSYERVYAEYRTLGGLLQP